jgi:hypothetical protein
MARGFLKRILSVALLLSLGACVPQGMPDPVGWASTYPHMCLPGFHALAPTPGWPGYSCPPNSNVYSEQHTVAPNSPTPQGPVGAQQ